MKRSSPIRRVPMLRAGQPIARGSAIRQQSARRQRQNRERAKVLTHVREVQTWCSRCGVTGVGLDAHELIRRSQWRDGVVVMENVILVCRECHEWIGANPREAVEQGWAKWSWQR